MTPEEEFWTEKLDKAILNWKVCGYLNNPKYRKDVVSFAKFIGYPTKDEDKWIVDINNPEIQRILDSLNGPHHKTIFKMLELKASEQ